MKPRRWKPGPRNHKWRYADDPTTGKERQRIKYTKDNKGQLELLKHNETGRK